MKNLFPHRCKYHFSLDCIIITKVDKKQRIMYTNIVN